MKNELSYSNTALPTVLCLVRRFISRQFLTQAFIIASNLIQTLPKGAMTVQSVEMSCHDSGDDSNKSTNKGHLHATIQHKLILVKELAVFLLFRR